MNRLASALAAAGRKLAGLFVEDRDFALAIAVWIALAALALRFSVLTRGYVGLIFFAGLLATLVGSVLRAAWSARRPVR
jgi:hypothetical protein